MPLDSVVLSGLTRELSSALTGARVDKIRQPERDTVILALRGPAGPCRLLLCAGVGNARIHLTAQDYENPQQPPMFCMLLRKHLGGARIAAVSQPAWERLVFLDFDAYDEMGAPVKKRLILELIGRGTNLILTDEAGRILDCMRRADMEMSPARPILPGLFYQLPGRQDKPLFFETDPAQLARLWQDAPRDAAADEWLLRTFAGLSPVLCRELCQRGLGEPSPRICALTEAQRTGFPLLLASFAESVRAGERTPTLLTLDGQPQDFSFLPLTQYGAQAEFQLFQDFSALLEAFYARRARAESMRCRARELTHTVRVLRDRTARKLALQQEELRKAAGREQYRRMGDLVTANLYRLKRGDTSLTAPDYWQDGAPEVTVALDPLKSPQQNAAAFYKEYNRMKSAEHYLTGLSARAERDLEYLDSVLDELERAAVPAELEEIRRELTETGFLRRAGTQKKQKPRPREPLRYLSSGGLEILVGRGNTQNDELTFRMARRGDIWLHAKDIPGSHVLLRTPNGQADEVSLREAASLAALHSRARGAGSVDVDWTPVRLVKKPSGALPGKVIYTGQHTVSAVPDEALAERLLLR